MNIKKCKDFKISIEKCTRFQRVSYPSGLVTSNKMRRASVVKTRQHSLALAILMVANVGE